MTAEVVNLVAALAALGAVILAVLEYRHVVSERRIATKAARQEKAEADQLELDGVAVQWHPDIRPNHPESDGTALWTYEITVHNPGRLPIRDVVVVLTFPVDVQRVHYDGALDPPSREIRLTQPVVLGQGSRVWRRELRIEFDRRDGLNQSSAEVTFSPLRARRRTNYMDGRPPLEGDIPRR